MKLTKKKINSFQSFIWNYYHQFGRVFAWRNTDNIYHVVVSEVMLQQTQTKRVEEKFEEFITTFPTVEILALSSLRDVLSVWQGLGYNRRGKFLHQLAQTIVQKYNGKIPDTIEQLKQLSGIGPYTAGSICAFAFNQPTIFIETNIRTVFIHTFFKNQEKIIDAEIMPLIEQTVDLNNPREWYYALMDYGVYLKQTFSNPSRKSRHYTKQSKFEGSDRQIRGKIIKLLTEHAMLTDKQIISLVNKEKKRTKKIIDQLITEKLIMKKGAQFLIE